MRATKNADGTISMTMTEEEAERLMYVVDEKIDTMRYSDEGETAHGLDGKAIEDTMRYISSSLVVAGVYTTYSD